MKFFRSVFEPADRLLAVIQSVTGPLRQITNMRMAQSKGRGEYQGQYRGRPLRVQILNYRSGLHGVSLGAPLGGRNVELSLSVARLAPGQAPAAPPHGEASLIPDGVATGFPVEVVRAALDAPTIAAIHAATRAAIGEHGLFVATDRGFLDVWVEAKTPPGNFGASPTPLPEPAELVCMLDFVFGLAERLVSAFDQAHAEVLGSGGPAAAAQWLAQHDHDKRVRIEQKATGTIVAVAIAILIMAVITGGIIALAVFVRC